MLNLPQHFINRQILKYPPAVEAGIQDDVKWGFGISYLLVTRPTKAQFLFLTI